MEYRIIIYEDNGKLRTSLKALLEYESFFTVVGDFADCDNVVNDVKDLRANVVIMDIGMPGIGGIEGVRKLKNSQPDVKIMMHTVFDDNNNIFESICAGADGYLLKNTNPKKFVESLRNLLHGDVVMSPYVAQKVFQHFRQQNLPEKDPFNLTKRETEVLQHLVNGNSYKMIADKMSVGIDAVKKHLQNIYIKLHVNCGTEAVAKAIKYRLVIVE